MNKERFWEEWKLELLQQIKVGDEIISEVKFALPKWGKDKVWELINNGQISLEGIMKASDCFDVGVDNGMIWRIERLVNSSNTEKVVKEV